MAKNTAIQTTENALDPELVHNLVINGDLAKMTPEMKVDYYNRFCQSLGLNPLTKPFQLLKFQGKEILYATKDCTEQLRKIHGVSITDVAAAELRGVYVVTAKALDKQGKTDAATGVVPVDGLKGEALANALMKAETKAKRRVTLSICGLGILDESELDTMPKHVVTPVDAPSVTLIEETKYASQDQKDAILKVLNNPVFTKEERDKIIGQLNNYSPEQAEKNHLGLKVRIEKRVAEKLEASKELIEFLNQNKELIPADKTKEYYDLINDPKVQAAEVLKAKEILVDSLANAA